MNRQSREFKAGLITACLMGINRFLEAQSNNDEFGKSATVHAIASGHGQILQVKMPTVAGPRYFEISIKEKL